MAWSPTIPAEPPVQPGWWHDLETAEQFETRRWAEGIAADLRAERIEQLHRRCHEVDMRCAGALSADRWERIQRRRDLQGAVYRPGLGLVSQWANRSHGGDEFESWGYRPGEVEHRGGGWVIGVR